MSFLLGGGWFILGIMLTLGGLYAVWRTEQNKWLSWFGFHRNLPWYSFVAVLTAGLLTAGLWFLQPSASVVELLLQSIIICILCVFTVSDVHFNVINIGLLVVGACAVLLAIVGGYNWVPKITSALAASLVATIFFLWQYLLSRGQWVGSGDAWLGAWLGLLVGWHEILIVTALGYAAAALTAFVLIVFWKKNNLNQLPLGTFLSMAALVYFFVIIVK